MSKLIPMACLALLGTAGHAWAEQTAETSRKTQQGVQQVAVSGARMRGTRRQFDVDGLWKLNTMSQLRLSADNLDPHLSETARSLDTGPLVQSAATLTHTYITLGIRHEMKL